MKKFIIFYFKLNLIYAACASMPSLFFDKDPLFLFNGVFAVIFMKFNVIYQLFQNNSLTKLSLIYLIVFCFFYTSFISKFKFRNFLNISLFIALSYLEIYINGSSEW